jgi:hypothetical protein
MFRCKHSNKQKRVPRKGVGETHPLFLNPDNVTVYEYIAEHNPDAANMVCRKYGFFQISNEQDLATCLQGIVAQGGESALKDVMECHPDKDALIELFDKKKEEDCSCNKTTTANAEGVTVAPAATPASPFVNQTNAYILVGAIIVAFAVMSIKK